jgi:Tol biopolymer transport system component
MTTMTTVGVVGGLIAGLSWVASQDIGEPVEVAGVPTPVFDREVLFATTGVQNDMDIAAFDVGRGQLRSLTAERSDEYDPAWSPDGTHIVYVKNENGEDANIFIMNSDGSEPRRLTSGPETDGNPAWSPDGTLIAFERAVEGDVDIYVVGPDGSDERPLVQLDGHDFAPAWSPDGGVIAFLKTEGESSQINLVDTATGSVVRPLATSEGHYGSLAWSPDGDSLAGTRRDATSDPEKLGPVDIVTIDVSSGDARTLLQSVSSWTTVLGWTPDGEHLGFLEGDGEQAELNVLSLSDGTLIRLPFPGGTTASW